MIAHDLDQKLLDRTVALAKQTGRFGWQALRAALDSSPLIGAGRVEDTWNLIGRALRTVATCAAKTLKISRDQVGVAAERVPSLGDPEMRHGRKTRTRLFTGYKRHVIKLVDADVIGGAIVRPANEPEHQALALPTPDLAPYGPLAELLIDRGYLGSPDIATLHARGVAIRAKAWTSTNRGRFPKSAFTIHLAAARVTCPAQQTAPILRGAGTVHFAAAVCHPCALRAACTTARGGRSVTIHPQE